MAPLCYRRHRFPPEIKARPVLPSRSMHPLGRRFSPAAVKLTCRDRLTGGGKRIRTLSSAAKYPPLGRPASVFERLGQRLATRQESGAQCAGCTSCADQDNGAICLESCWGKCIRIRCFHTEDRAVACQRCSCDRALGVCKLRPVWSCVARHSNETRALRLPGPRHPS